LGQGQFRDRRVGAVRTENGARPAYRFDQPGGTAPIGRIA
jgi:hypothetical protein